MLFGKVVLVSSYDASDATAWSGVPYHFLSALKRTAREVVLTSPLQPQNSSKIMEKVQRYKELKKVYFPDRDLEVLKTRAIQTNNLLMSNRDADCVLVLNPPEAAYLETGVPLIIIHDALWAQFTNSYPFLSGVIARESDVEGMIVEREAVDNATLIVLFSEWAAEAARREYPSLANRIRVNPPGANLDIIPSREEVLAMISQRQPSACTILFVGAEAYRKGLDIALEVLNHLVDSGISASMDVVGIPKNVHSRPSPFDLGMHSSIQERLHFYGHLSKAVPDERALLATLYANASFILIPSRADCGSLALCDAAAFGLPAVSSGVGGIAELVSSGCSGLIVGAGAKPVQYATCIQEAISTSAGYRLLCEGARFLHEETLNWDAHIRRLVNIVSGRK
jgi:glycosyltransferase involved in cell wall biosynthesis